MYTEKIKADMVTAMKSGDKLTKNVLSLTLNALQITAKNKRSELTSDEELQVIAKELKQTNESLEFMPADRADDIKELKHKIEILKRYLPQQLTQDEIQAILIETIKELNIEQPTAKDKGSIMKQLMPKLKGKADGKAVNEVITNYLK